VVEAVVFFESCKPLPFNTAPRHIIEQFSFCSYSETYRF